MISDILVAQKRELERRLKERYVRRSLQTLRDNDLIKVVIGPRRAGKSFLAMHLLHPLAPFGYINFDDERLIEVTDYDELVAALDSIYKSPKHVLLDEIQNLPKWELFVNRLQRQGYRLVVTGSNAHLLGTDLATHLTGRHVLISLFPFSYSEYLRLMENELTQTEKQQAFRDYIETGGFPEPLVKDIDAKEYVRTLWDSVLYKDIVRRHRIRTAQGMEDLGRYLLSNIANEYSCNALTKVTRCKSMHTVKKYLRHFEEAFVLFSLSRFSFKVKDQARVNKKIYCIDNAFVTSVAFQTSPDNGKLCENAVAVALRRMALSGRAEVFFWRNLQQEEVDFVIKEGVKVTQLLQVCWDPGEPKTRNREVRSLLKAAKELHCENLVVLTGGAEFEDAVEWYGIKGNVRFLPAWKWLLETDQS